MKKKIFLTLLFVCAGLMLSYDSCDINDSSAEKDQQNKTNQMRAEANRQIGMPDIKNFQELKLMKLILEARDKEDLILYAYSYSEMTGKYTYIGRCVGYGLPYATQFTNPQKITDWTSQGGYAILPQCDPNMLYLPASADGTWLYLIDPKTNKPRVACFEPKIVTIPFELPDGIVMNYKDDDTILEK